MKRLLFVLLWATATLARLYGKDVEQLESLQFKQNCMDGPISQRPIFPENSSKVSCVIGRCTATCADGFQLPDGATELKMFCRGGVWLIGDSQLQKAVPSCKPICESKCQNGGICVEPNVCHCKKNFRGPQCQYSKERCSLSKLEFNGNIKCKSNREKVKCTLSCPQWTSSTARISNPYTCRFDQGRFQPRHVPKCHNLP